MWRIRLGAGQRTQPDPPHFLRQNQMVLSKMDECFIGKYIDLAGADIHLIFLSDTQFSVFNAENRDSESQSG